MSLSIGRIRQSTDAATFTMGGRPLHSTQVAVVSRIETSLITLLASLSWYALGISRWSLPAVTSESKSVFRWRRHRVDIKIGKRSLESANHEEADSST